MCVLLRVNHPIFSSSTGKLNLILRPPGKCFVNSNGSTRDSVIIQWIKLKNGMIKLNTNGSSLGNPGPAGFGGLSLAVNKGFLRIEVDSDCLEAINLISKSDNSIHYLGVIISYIKALGSRFEAISFNHVFREVNHCADALAKLGSKDRVELHVWENPPSVISLGLMAHLAATSFYRM
ncbi:Ribonuclease H [Senna tora]|uniref:Ribonuclease H n=1 Tax=Senna tora TaxID=362788 RepID=A0A834SJ38_9FABA|nr:Ribonuclease H [Senna tora]